ncbi:MAG: hypothetical protein ABI795_08395 [Chthoniobacterales bacterium]|nr:hypothetical protein [Chthoniobacterales bacterium]
MRLPLRQCASFVAAGALIFFCSCERHHLAELSEDQAVDPAKAERAEAKSETGASPVAGAIATPVNFFPEAKKP